jgi:hypothetical protein
MPVRDEADHGPIVTASSASTRAGRRAGRDAV